MRFPLVTRYSDYDTKGHVNNALYLTYFEVAKHFLWRETWKQDPDPPFVVAEATVRFVSPAMIGDPLEIDISTREIRNRSWVWQFRITDARDDRVVAEGSTVQVYYDYTTRTAMAIPADVRALLESGLA
ncbi:MAG TPA: thioesterase family protein [Gemmatimonadaceae bacterium]